MDTNQTGVVTWEEYWAWVQKWLKSQGHNAKLIEQAKKDYSTTFAAVANGHWYIDEDAAVAYIKKTTP